MSALKTIRTHNIQSHKDVLIELPETGLVVFSGDNSNGKSVIRKVIEDVIANNINKVKVRKSLINRHATEGCLELVKYNGTTLYVNLNLEASQTWVKLTRRDGTEVTRYLADKSIPELINEFGFHYNAERGVSLNICDSDDSILFFRTNHVTNGDILSSALTDTDAQAKYEVLLSNYQEALSLRRTFQDNIKVANLAKEAITLYDIDKEEVLQSRCSYIANILSHIYIPQILEPLPIPAVVSVALPVVRLESISVGTLVDLPSVTIREIKPLYKELMELEKGVCPTCQRPFYLCQTCTSET